MKIAFKDILKFLEDKPDIEDLSSKLFQLGHEHEIEDSVFDMEFTPNRGDCLSVEGLVRDLNVFYKINLDSKIYSNKIPELKLNFINRAEDMCPYISFLNIEIKDNISEYKDYLNNYFNELKINKNNFFADVSNYIAYEMGQPTHCYDFKSIGNDITLKINNNNTKFTTLLNNTINLNGSDLVFTSDEKIINLSGIMGSLETACSKTTTNALVECAYFQPESIIGKAIKYNLHSDASHKFERGTDPQCHERALRRFIQIVSEHAEITKLELYTNSGPKFQEVELRFDLEKINKILGLNENADKYKSTLNRLGFDVNKSIKVPSYRNDIHHQNDLAEEFARVIGFDNIPVSIFSIQVNKDKLETKYSNENKFKAFLIDNGFIEVINSPFCSIRSSNSIKVDNPLDTNRENIRANLTDSLVDNVIFNEKRQKDSIKLFEISDIYSFNNGIQKKKRLAAVISGRQGLNYLEFSKALNKKYFIDLFKKINIDITDIILNLDRDKMDSKIKTPIFAIEFNIEDFSPNFESTSMLNKSFSDLARYKPVSEFPSSFRDFSFSIKDSSKIILVINLLSDIKSNIIKNSFMFDFYKNEKLNETKIGYRFIFQSHEKTLTDAEINEEIKKIIEATLLIDSVSLPGSS